MEKYFVVVDVVVQTCTVWGVLIGRQSLGLPSGGFRFPISIVFLFFVVVLRDPLLSETTHRQSLI